MHVHQQQVAHRDLKPQNILLDHDRILLADLGLSVFIGDVEEARLTKELERIGSIHYTPPEAFVRQPIDERQYAFDAYAVGKILYEMLAGRVLPMFTSPNEKGYDLTEQHPTPEFRDLNRVLRGLLHGTPEVRIATLAELPAQLQDLITRTRAQEGEPANTTWRVELSTAREALARLVHPTASIPQPGTPPDADQLTAEIWGVWQESEALRELRANLAADVAATVQSQPGPGNRKLRDLLANAIVRTRHALEPFEDGGYPRRPTHEAGCAVGFVPGAPAPRELPELWLGVLVGEKETSVWVALGIVHAPRIPGEPTDLLTKTVRVAKTNVHRPGDIQEVREMAGRLAEDFTRRVIQAVQKSS